MFSFISQPFAGTRLKSIVLVGVLIAGLSAVFMPSGAANATPRVKPDKVTICHRTHSVTNPYRKITVAKSSVDGDLNIRSRGNGNNANGDHAGTTHNPLDLVQNGSSRKVFDPTYTYPNNAKKWQDIIPAFTVDENSGTVTYSGLNWDAAGKAIYFGTGSFYGLCKKMSAKDYLNSEVAAGQSASNVLADLREQASEEDSGIDLSTTDGLRNLLTEPTGPRPPANVQNPDLNSNTVTPFDSLTQSIAGVVWYDDNHNGIQDGTETIAPGVTVKLLDPSGNPYTTTPAFKKLQKQQTRFRLASNITALPVTYSGTLTTDSNGAFVFPSVPEGLWTVSFVAPSGFTFTYDAYGSADGATQPIVPEGGAGFTWAGLISSSTSWTYSTGDPLSSEFTASDAQAEVETAQLVKTGVSPVAPIIGLIGIVIVGLGVALLVARRREKR